MRAVRPDIALLEQNGITGVAADRLDDPSVIPLWFGEGDTPTASFIRKAAISALEQGETFYTYPRGLPDLRQAIGSYLESLYDVSISPDRISIPGSSMLGVTIAVQIAVSAGDDALVVSPHWPNIETCYRVAGANVNFVRQRETSGGWTLSADEIIEAVTPATKSIYVNSPCNPTGWVMDREQQRQLLAYCRENNVLLIADEVYHRHVHPSSADSQRDVAPSFLEIAEEDDPVVVVNGFSKAWAMTGWRVGWVVAPVSQLTAWTVMAECFNTGATVFAQHGCLAALQSGDDEVRRLRDQYMTGRQLVLDALSDHPRIQLSPPNGAFYAFPQISNVSDSRQFAERLLAEADVGVAPGYTFGEGNRSHIRLCFALSHDRLTTGLERIVRFVDNYPT